LEISAERGGRKGGTPVLQRTREGGGEEAPKNREIDPEERTQLKLKKVLTLPISLHNNVDAENAPYRRRRKGKGGLRPKASIRKRRIV